MLVDELQILVVAANPRPCDLVALTLPQDTPPACDAGRPQVMLAVNFFELKTRVRRILQEEPMRLVGPLAHIGGQSGEELPEVPRCPRSHRPTSSSPSSFASSSS